MRFWGVPRDRAARGALPGSLADPAQVSLVYLAARLMESVWSTARFRYLKERPEGMHLWTTPVYEEVTQRLPEDEEAGVLIESMHMELLYHLDPEAAEPEGRDAA
jgi:hypothetical protein